VWGGGGGFDHLAPAGGIVAIPILIYLLRIDVKKVAATSLGIVVFSALTATVTYVLAGWGRTDMPPGSAGFVFLPAGLALLPGAVLTVRVGVRLNRRMNPRGLRVLFGLLFLFIGARLFLESVPSVLG